MREVYYPGTRDVYGAGYKLARVPLLGRGKRDLTFYRRHGDMFGWGCVAWSVMAFGRVCLRGKKRGA